MMKLPGTRVIVRCSSRTLKRLGAACASLLLLAAEAGAAGEAIDFRWHHFSDNQGTRVSTTSFDVSKPWSGDNGRISLTYSLDEVSMPAIQGAPGSQEHLDAITAASRPVSGVYLESENYEKRRHQLEATLGRGDLSGIFYTSIEEDWRAHQAGLGWRRELAQSNAILGIEGSYGWDHVTPLDEDGGVASEDRRSSLSAVGSWTQTLDLRTQSRLSLEVGRLSGIQSNPYRSVRTDSTIVPESHPRERVRSALAGELLRYLDSRSSLRLGYRFYRDDWQVQSHTGNLEFKQVLGESLILRYRYRYYTQTDAYFYREDYVDGEGVDGYLTSDYKLASLSSNLFGVKLSVPALDLLHLSGVFSEADLSVKFERYYTSTDFSAGIIETGIEVVF
jgi:hypothetical protein